MGIQDYIEELYGITEVDDGNQARLNDCECPFCGHVGKVYINYKLKCGICFQCSEGFTANQFVMANEDCTYQKSIKIINGTEDPDPYVKKEVEKLDTPKEDCVLKLIELPRTAKDYLIGREIDQNIIDQFQIKYCDDLTFFNEKWYNTKERIIVPIFTIDRKFTGWQGRDISGISPVKYLMSPTFKASEHLFNAWNINCDCDYLIICEGIFDLFGWVSKGFKNCIATFGKKISKEQIRLLKRINPKRVYIAWDYNCIVERMEFIEKYGHLFDIKDVQLPEKDSDECTQVELLNAFKNAQEYSWESKILYSVKL